jgi:Mn-containing catalase
MFFHRKETIIPVNVKTPDPRFGTFLLEQFGGATGELTAALQYWVQSFHITDASIRDMLQDIALEEFSHLEVVGKLIEQHTSTLDQTVSGRISLTARVAPGPRLISTRAAMSCATCGPISRPRLGRGRPMRR